MNVLEDKIIEWRRHFHKHPELSFCEKNTSDFIANILNSLEDVEVTRPGSSGIIATIKGAAAGPAIALRGDMDALPIMEENTAEYVSLNPGVMHACGHDAHTAMLLGTLMKLHGLRHEWEGEIRFLFQHGEEVLPGGAVDLIKAGALKGVSAILGAHVSPYLNSGEIGIVYGPAMASPDDFSITIKGKGGHAALPQLAIDPVMIGAQMAMNLQTIVSRSIDPLDSAVLSITQFHAGTAYNVIPSTATISGTARMFKQEVRDQIKEKIHLIAQGLAAANGAECDLQYKEGYPSVINDQRITAILEDAVKKELGEAAAVITPPLMAGEDFGEYQKHVPGCFYFVGITGGKCGLGYPLHHPLFDIDESAMIGGVNVMARGALELLNRKIG